MTDNTENLVLEHLRAIRGQLDNIAKEIVDLKFRINKLERGQADIMEYLAHHSGRFDRTDERLDRIERRLNLVEV